MTHVSILVPHGSILPSSVLGLCKIFDLANHHLEEGSRGGTFELHLVGGASTADLYGGRCVAKPDLTLAEAATTDVAIIPAMAGNVAEAIKNNSAFIPWIREQYQGGCEIAGLCTGASFIIDAGLIRERYCSWHWFVDATFRKQYQQINSLAEEAAAAPECIHGDSGAWLFLQTLLERVVGKKAALACSASFQEAFNRECQSVVSVSDPRRQHAKRIAKKKWALVDRDLKQQTTVERLLSRFEVSRGAREGSLSVTRLFENSLRTPVGNTNPRASCALSDHEEQGRTDNQNARTWKALFKKTERLEGSYGNVEA